MRSIPHGGADRAEWENVLGNMQVGPLRFFYPNSLEELQAVIQDAKMKGCKVRSTGSGHSFTDVAITTDFLIDPHELNRMLEIDSRLLRNEWKTKEKRLVRVENGIRICDLNDALDALGLGLINMGSYTAQTIIGAISTSTHGSGMELGPLPDMVRSIEILDGDGNLIRIEPNQGPTDPQEFARLHPQERLIQEDSVFYSSVVAMGCVGVVYAVTLEVRERYFLKEVRTPSTWGKVRQQISLGGTLLTKNEHVDIYLNPHPNGGDHFCIIGTRNEVPISSTITERSFIYNFLSNIPGISIFFKFLFNTFYALTPEILDDSMKSLIEDNYTNVSYKVLDLGGANRISAYASEIAFSMENDNHVRSIEAILQVIAQCREIGQLYTTVPIGIRFVRKSPHYLSMMYERETCMVEVPCVKGTIGGMEILYKIEERLCTEEFKGRPHWGQINFLNREKVQRLYSGSFELWLKNYKLMNRSEMFSNSFTNRCGLD